MVADCSEPHELISGVWCGSSVPPTSVHDIFSRHDHNRLVRVYQHAEELGNCATNYQPADATSSELIPTDGATLDKHEVARIATSALKIANQQMITK